MKMMRRAVALVMSFVLMLSMRSPILADEIAIEKETVVGNVRVKTEVTIDDIDLLVEQRNQAYINEDWEQIDNITEELHMKGMSSISLAEINELTDQENVPLARSGATFETVYSVYQDGKGNTYNLMRIYATPTTSSDLYKKRSNSCEKFFLSEG